MAKQLSGAKLATIPSLPDALSSIGISGRVSTKDSFTIEYSDGLLVATVRKRNGMVQTSRRSVDGSFQEATSFDPESVSKKQRNALIKRLASGRMTQSEIARRTGVSQATVSNVLRK
ncbi:MAG TPA: winged helix-turn-helix domain-containing protein [Allosphingosinicella sp.]|jgi:DNA-binding NarL/FixJ family response regulator